MRGFYLPFAKSRPIQEFSDSVAYYLFILYVLCIQNEMNVHVAKDIMVANTAARTSFNVQPISVAM